MLASVCPGAYSTVKPELGRRRAQLRDVVGRERRLLEEERRDAILLHDGQVIGGRAAAAFARRLRERDKPQAVEDPSRDRQHAAIGEVIVVVLERFLRVERVLGQRVGAGGGRRPRVDERCLNDVVALVRSPDEAAAVVDDDVDLRILVDRAGESRGTGRA